MSKQFDRLHNSAETMHTLADKHLISHVALEYALTRSGLRPDRAAWQYAIRLALLVVGLGLVVAGVFHFISWNWDMLTPVMQLAMVGTAVLIGSAVAAWRGIMTLTGHIALSAAAALLGGLPLIYQLNWRPDWPEWAIPAIWSLLALGWVLVARFAPLWLAWLLLLCITTGVFWDDVVGRNASLLYILLALIGLGALIFWERRALQGLPNFAGRWWPRVVATLSLVILLFPSLGYVAAEFGNWRDDFGALALIAYFGLTVGLLWFYRRRVRDLLPLTAAVLGLVMMSVAFIWQLTNLDNAGWLLLTGVLVVAETALAVRWLQSVARSWEVVDGGVA